MRIDSRSQKFRHEVAVQRFAAPQRDAAPRDLEEFWERRHTYYRATNAPWVDAGPCNFAGRVTCLDLAVPKDTAKPKVLYAGSAAGGLWKSEDWGETWASCWPNALNQNIGAVAVDPDDPLRIVCATGEGNLATASYPGSGIYQSYDGGFTWRSYLVMSNQRRMSSQDRDAMPRRVSGISFSADQIPGNLRRAAFAAISNDDDLAGGLYLSRDDGSIEFVDHWSNRPYNCYSAIFHPTLPGKLYVSIEAGGSVNGIHESSDGGKTWRRLHRGLPHGTLCGRISLAISRTKPDVLFALISTRPAAFRRNRGERVLGVYRSLNAGRDWERYGGTEFDEEEQLGFNNTIAIHPGDHRIAVCGANGLFRTEDLGETWSPISEGSAGDTPTKKNPLYVHPDQHAILMPGGRAIFAGNDGGVFKSEDLGETWRESSHQMGTVMFYALDVSAGNARIYGGGTQDNGVLLAGVKAGKGLRPPKDQAFTQVLPGDGGYVVCDPDQQELVFASTFDTNTHYHSPGQAWAKGLFTGTWHGIAPNVPQAEKDVLGLTVMAIKPRGAGGAGRKLFLGTNRLWEATFKRAQGQPSRWHWQPVPFANFDGSAISAIEIATADARVMFVGTARGGIFRSGDGGANWTEDLAGPAIPNRVITQIETHPRRAREVVVTVASSGRPLGTLRDEKKPYSRVFRSIDSGNTWQDIDGGQLPRVVFNGLAFETHPPYRIFVAGDAGPWVLNPDGRWVSIAGDMPSAVISDIIYHHKTRTLTAATYGRGIWRLNVPRKFEIQTCDQQLESDFLLPEIEGFFLDRTVPTPEPKTPVDPVLADPALGFTPFTCSPVEGAIGYVFEATSAAGRNFSGASPTPAVELRRADSSPHTWRCWALFPGGRCSFPSPAISFRYFPL